MTRSTSPAQGDALDATVGPDATGAQVDPSRPYVVGLVLVDPATDGTAHRLRAVLDSLSHQTRHVDAVVLVARDTDSIGRLDDVDPSAFDVAIHMTGHELSPSITDAAMMALDRLGMKPSDDEAASTWWWVMSDTVTPRRAALEELLAVAAGRPDAGIIGCKHRAGASPARLINNGFLPTVGGHDIPVGAGDDHDQGQYDHLSDVSSVSVSGALVRADVLDQLGGMERHFDPAGAMVDLCRRTRGAGHGVVVAPRAVATGLRPDPLSRADAVRLRLIHSSPWLIPFTVLGIICGAVVRFVGRLLIKDARRGVRGLGATLKVLANPVSWLLARRRYAKARKATKHCVLLAPHSEIRLGMVETLRWHRDRVRAMFATDTDEPRRAPGHARRRAWSGIATALVTSAFLMVWSAVTWWPFLTAERLTGGALGDGWGSPSALMDSGTAYWRGAGLGSTGPADQGHLVLGALTYLAGGSPDLAAKAVLFGAMPLAAFTMWSALTVVTTSSALRLWAGLTWAATPAFLMSLHRGQLAFALAWILLPTVGEAIARSTAHRSPARMLGRASVAGLGVALLGALNTPLGIVGFVACVVVAVRRPHPRLARMWQVLCSGVVVVPFTVLAISQGGPQAILAELGYPTSVEPAAAWRWLLGTASGNPRWDFADGLPLEYVIAEGPAILGAIVPMVAFIAVVVSLGATSKRKVFLTVGLGMCAGAVIVAALTSLVPVAEYGPIRMLRPAEPWVATATAGLIVAACAGLAGIATPRRKRGRTTVTRQAVSILAGGLLVGLASLSVLAAPWLSRPPAQTALATTPPPDVPLVAQDVAQTTDATRSLVLRPRADGIVASLRRGNGETVAGTSTVAFAHAANDTALTGAARPLADVVSALSTPGSDPVDQLVDLGVGFVVVLSEELPADESVDEEAEASTSQVSTILATIRGVDSLTTASAAEGIRAWRVVPPGSGSADAGDRPVAAKMITSGDAMPQPVPVTARGHIDTLIPAGSPNRQLILAEAQSPHWKATLNGSELPSRTVNGWAQGFTVGQASGRLVVTSEPSWWRPLLWAQAVLVVLALIFTLPSPRSAPPVRRALSRLASEDVPERVGTLHAHRVLDADAAAEEPASSRERRRRSAGSARGATTKHLTHTVGQPSPRGVVEVDTEKDTR